MKAVDKRIAAQLVAYGDIPESDLQGAIARFSGKGSLADFLAAEGLATPRALARAAATASGFAFIDLSVYEINSDATEKLDRDESWRAEAIPVGFEGGKTVVAIHDPNDVFGQDELKLKLGAQIDVRIAEKDDLYRAMLIHYGRPTSGIVQIPETLLADFERKPEEQATAEISTLDSEDSHRIHQRRMREMQTEGELGTTEGISALETVIEEIETSRKSRAEEEEAREAALDTPDGQRAREILNDAIHRRVEEIEFLPNGETATVKFRIQRYWHPVATYETSMHQGVLQSIRAMCGLDQGDPVPDGQLTVRTKSAKAFCRLHFRETAQGTRLLVRFPENVPLLGNPLLNLRLPADVARGINNRLRKAGGGLLFLSSPSMRTLDQIYHSLLVALSNMGSRDVMSLETKAERALPDITSLHCPDDEALIADLESSVEMAPDVLGIHPLSNARLLNQVLDVAIQGTTVVACYTSPDAETAEACFRAGRIDEMKIVQAVNALVHIEEAFKLCEYCHRQIENRESLPDWAQEMTTPFFEKNGCDKCDGTGFIGTTFLAQVMQPELQKDDRLFRMSVDRTRDIVAQSIAGKIDPRDYDLE